MNRILVLLFLFATVTFAQLVPPGMVLPAAGADSTVTADSVAPTPVVEQPAPANMVEVPEGQSKNWDGYEPANPDSLRYYEVEIFHNDQQATHKHAIANMLNVVALGGGLIGLGFFGSSYFMDDGGKKDAFRYVGEGLMVGALVSAGFAFGFDVSSQGFQIKAQYYSQKLVDYKKRHSALEVEQ